MLSRLLLLVLVGFAALWPVAPAAADGSNLLSGRTRDGVVLKVFYARATKSITGVEAFAESGCSAEGSAGGQRGRALLRLRRGRYAGLVRIKDDRGRAAGSLRFSAGLRARGLIRTISGRLVLRAPGCRTRTTRFSVTGPIGPTSCKAGSEAVARSSYAVLTPAGRRLRGCFAAGGGTPVVRRELGPWAPGGRAALIEQARLINAPDAVHGIPGAVWSVPTRAGTDRMWGATLDAEGEPWLRDQPLVPARPDAPARDAALAALVIGDRAVGWATTAGDVGLAGHQLSRHQVPQTVGPAPRPLTAPLRAEHDAHGYAVLVGSFPEAASAVRATLTMTVALAHRAVDECDTTSKRSTLTVQPDPAREPVGGSIETSEPHVC